MLDVVVPPARARRRPEGDQPPAELAALAGDHPARGVTGRGRDGGDRPRHGAGRTPADAYLRLHLLSHRLVAPARPEPRRHLRRPHQRRVDLRSARARSTTSRPPGSGSAPHGPSAGLRHRQVPADDRLRRPDRRPDRRRRPGPARRPPRRGHHRHARGLRQLQRRHPRRIHGRGPDLRRRRRRRRLRRRRRRLDHGHPLRRRQRRSSPSASAACSAPTPGIGISLGDDCVVEAGCYVTAGTKVTIPDIDSKPKVVKAADLSGADNVLFRRNSVTGAIEAVPWKGAGIALNAALHAN